MAHDQGLEFIMSQSASHGPETGEDRAPGTQVSYVQAAVMDIIAVLLFALLARIAHNSPELPFSWGGVLATAWPFLLGAAAGFGVDSRRHCGPHDLGFPPQQIPALVIHHRGDRHVGDFYPRVEGPDSALCVTRAQAA